MKLGGKLFESFFSRLQYFFLTFNSSHLTILLLSDKSRRILSRAEQYLVILDLFMTLGKEISRPLNAHN